MAAHSVQPGEGRGQTPDRRWRSLVGWFEPTAPRVHRGPFARWPRATDTGLALLVLAGSLVSVSVSGLPDDERYTVGAVANLAPGAYPLLGAGALALLWRRRQPTNVAIVIMVMMVAWAIFGYGDGHDLSLMVATYSVGRYTEDHRLGAMVMLGAIAVSALGTLLDANQRIDIVPALLLTAIPWYTGRRVRERGAYLALLHERAAHLESERDAEARRAVTNERSRIARELHDVVAHQVSMMTVQAGAAKTVAGNNLEMAVQAMADVENAGRQALTELRHLLGVLRADSSDPDDLGPQRGLGDVDSLLEQLSHTGANIALTRTDVLEELAASVDLSAYRIIQESLTNIVKHAGEEPAVNVLIDANGDLLEIEIINSCAGNTAELPESGYGIAGMKERAARLGGSLTAGPLAHDRFRVHALLPLRPEPL